MNLIAFGIESEIEEQKTMMQMTTITPEIIIAEEYAVELTKTGRGIIAEVKDTGSPFNGVYALGSIASCAIASLKTKIREMGSR